MTALYAAAGAAGAAPVLSIDSVRILKTLDAAAGTAIVGFGGLLAWRTLRESS